MKGGIRLMDKDSFIIGLLEDGFDAEDAENVETHWDKIKSLCQN